MLGGVAVGCSPPPVAQDGTVGLGLSGSPADGVDLEADADGDVWVGWVEAGRYRLTHGDGVRFSAAIDLGEASASLARRPRLAVGDGRVAVVRSDGITNDARVVLRLGDAAGFETIVLDALDGSTLDVLDQPTVAFSDGAVVASWKVGFNHDTAIAVARETDGFTREIVTALPPPCPCCPHEVAFAEGDLMLLQRSDQANLREIHLGRERNGQMVTSRVSWNDWVVAGCPFDGPKIANDGGLVVTWMDGTPGRATVWVARSDDGGATWSQGVPVLDRDLEQVFPNVVATADALWLTVEALFEATWVLRSEDGGETWDEVARLPLTGVDLAPGGLAGIDAGGVVRFVPLPR